jgi:hypothetical protein
MAVSCNFGDMVAVASGSENRVAAWGKALRAAAIGFMVVTPVTDSKDDNNDTELWVTSGDVDEARHALRSYVEAHDGQMW